MTLATALLLLTLVTFFEALAASSTPREQRIPIRAMRVREHALAVAAGVLTLTRLSERRRHHRGLFWS